MNNYEYCTRFVLDAVHSPEAKVLDYGCGAGQIVTALRTERVDAFGCDVFYGGGDASKAVPSELLGTVIREVEHGRIPFSDATFDVVINNQVMEHVEDLGAVLDEIQRVVKPAGVVLSLFPDRSVWREGHCGIPFLHWFRKGTRLRIYYATFLRLLGFGHYTAGKSPLKWSKDFCEWLDKWTRYRSYVEIREAYEKYFVKFEHIEDRWLLARFAPRLPLVKLMPRGVQRFIVRKLAGLVFVVSKRAA